MAEINYVCGRNAVLELIKSGNSINKVLLLKSQNERRNSDIIHLLNKRAIPYQLVEKTVLDKYSAGAKHQGVLAFTAGKDYVEVEDILEIARQKGEEPLILMLDGIEDPHNFGALLRTADAAGVHGVIIPKRRSVGYTAVVSRTSAGAVEYVAVARVTNLVQTIKLLQDQGCWVSGAEVGGKDLFSADLSGPRVIVIGGEGKGLARLVRETCDEIVSVPMFGKISSLNASVAGSIILYEVRRQRIQALTGM